MASFPVSQDAQPAVSAILPLALLEAMRGLDAPVPDELDEYHQDLSAKRFGMSRTVEAQIERFGTLARNGRRVPADELIALIRLAARRPDAGLVFTDAGQRAGRRAARGVASTFAGTRKALPSGIGKAVGFRAARQRAERVFGAEFEQVDGVPQATMTQSPAVVATADGAACAFYGAAFAQLLRDLTDFDGAMLHIRCRTRGDDACVWRASADVKEKT